MGREIRRVPPNWQHPKTKQTRIVNGRYVEVLEYQPMRAKNFAEAMDAWYAGWKKWEAGERDQDADPDDTYWDWYGNPPNPEYYSHHKPEECTWFQVYETVSEGTPVTPAFATTEELTAYLAEHGDFWDQRRVKEGRREAPAAWGIEAAKRFVSLGYAPTMARTADGHILEPRDGI